jgi:malate dehydrogenase
VAELSPAVVAAGGMTALDGCDVVVLAASAAQHNLLESNLKIIEAVAGPLVRYCPGATVITASNPVDVLSYRLCEISGLPRTQFVGFSRNDSARFRVALARLLDVPVRQVEALVVGEHGPAMVPVFSAVYVNEKKVDLSPEQRGKVSEYLKNWLVSYEALQSGRTNTWTTAVGVGFMIESIARRTGDVLPASAILHGEYGLSRVSVGVPCVLGPGGVVRIVELKLEAEEQAGLKAAAAKIRRILDTCVAAKAQAAN